MKMTIKQKNKQLNLRIEKKKIIKKKNKIKRKIGEPFIDENKEYTKKLNLISSPIHK